MKVGTVFHPRYPYHARPVANGRMTATIEVYATNGQHEEWEPGVGMVNPGRTLIWKSKGSVQPNIDWRARTRDHAGEFNATMAVRFDLPIGMNEVGAVKVDGKIVSYGPDPVFALGDIVIVTESPVSGTESLIGREYTVRNALPSSYMWQHNLLCDVGTNING